MRAIFETRIRTNYPELLKELAKRLEDPERKHIELCYRSEREKHIFDRTGWDLEINSEFRKTY